MKVGFTTSFPVEVVYAAGHIPLDLNNIFITGDAAHYVEQAEFKGFPRNLCAWIKGLYSVAISENFPAIIGVVEGDCSNTHSLMSILNEQKIEIIPFSFPYNRKYTELDNEIKNLEEYFHTDRQKVEMIKFRFDQIRKKLITLDKMTYSDNVVSGLENHLWLVNSSDFEGNPNSFEQKLDDFIIECNKREPFKQEIRIGFLGVPPIIGDLYGFLEENNARIVFNEIQRQFSMPYLTKDIVTQYLRYTYPYSIYERLNDIKTEVAKRNLDGLISYSQSFCHRQIDNIILKKKLNLPILTLEGDQPGDLDARSKLRIESFLDMLRFE